MSRKMRSAEALRQRLIAWLKECGGEQLSESEHNSILGGVIGGDWRIMTQLGWLIVHLPGDEECIHSHQGKKIGLLDINTRFEDWSTGKLPADANPYSGKWNFGCYESEDRLFADFTNRLSRLLNPPKPSDT